MTTPIAIAVSEQLGGVTSITVAAVIVTGILGAITAPLMARLFRVRDGIAKGVAIGTCSHAVGTTKALEMGELEGAMSGVSIAVSGLLTTAIVIVASCFRSGGRGPSARGTRYFKRFTNQSAMEMSSSREEDGRTMSTRRFFAMLVRFSA